MFRDRELHACLDIEPKDLFTMLIARTFALFVITVAAIGALSIPIWILGFARERVYGE